RRLNELALAREQRAPVALRINPDVAAHTHPHIATGHGGAKFGIDLAKADRVARDAAKLPGIELAGLACHIGSQISAIEPYRAAAARLMALAERLHAHDIKLQHMDFGGGFGVRYHAEPPLDVDALLGELRSLAQAQGLALHIEPGRAIVASAGALLTRVEYVKTTSRGRCVIVDAGMTELIRPALYDAWHEIREVAPRDNAAAAPCDVVGPVCESADFLGHGRRLTAEAGNLLAVMDAGAYGMSMASNYNARPRAAEVLVDGAQATLIRRRETVADLIVQEILL
ncbi:MAG: diaminopimelate decarboxylase, partial [Rhizomicrobium sp.]